MTKLVEKLRACLIDLEEHHNEIDGWRSSSDATPSLYLLGRNPGEIEAGKVDLPPWVFGMRKTLGGLLVAGADLMSEHQEIMSPLVPPNLTGVAVVCEGWALSAAEAEDFERIAHSRRVHQHPNRRETRMAVGAFITGGPTVHSIMRFRRGNQVHVFPDGDDVTALEGGIPDGLRYLADTILMISAMRAR